MTITVSEARGLTKRSSNGSSNSTPAPTPSSFVMDPLGAALDGTDPLSQFAMDLMTSDNWNTVDTKKNIAGKNECMEPWSTRRAAILNKFTTSEKLSVVSSFLSSGEKVVVKAQSSVVRNRLEQLDDFEEGSMREMTELTQQEYINTIEQLNKELVSSWNQDHRVDALKIAIQCAKLLADTSVIQFYPSKFVLVTDILDIFGKLLYERLRTKAEYFVPGNRVATCLPENFTPDMVPESAKEICRNWFYKCASIRELVPRFYIEAAILKSYKFFNTGDFSQDLNRLTKTIRGIGDPLVAVYARCYLCRIGMSVTTINRQFLKDNFYDFLQTYHQMFSGPVRAILSTQKIDMYTYLNLYTPALDWIMQGLAHNAPESLLVELLGKCYQKANSALLLNTIMTSFRPLYIASRALHFVELISACNSEGFPQYLLFRSLGHCLSVAETEQPLQVLNEVWKFISKLSHTTHYISCAEVWVHFITTHFSNREVNAFLGDVIQHVTPNRAYEQFYPQLQTIIENIISNTSDFESLFIMDKFLPLIDLFHGEFVKVNVCKSIMTDYMSRGNLQLTNDPVVTDALMYICRGMHDSVSVLTVDDEKRQIGLLISQLVRQVNFGRDFEQQLSYYVDARAAFTNLDSVHTTLVQCVNKLSMETSRIVKGHHTRKTSSFVRACAAYCYITIPSIVSEMTRLQLYLLSAQVALMNQCLNQADACLKTALSLVPELPTSVEIDGKMRSTEPFLVSYLCQFLSLLLIVPDNPQQGVLYLTRGLLNVLQHYTWEPNSSARAKVYLYVLDMLTSAAQETYPYHIKKVDSNDVFYGSDPKFIAEINKMCSTLVEEILNHLKYLDSIKLYQKQSVLAYELFMRIVLHGDLTSPGLAMLALNLWNLANKHKFLDSKLAARTIEYLKRRVSHQATGNVYYELINKLEV
ncbi:VPS35 endosomal protein-sorting factor-like isoform X2 [Lycorma delicatula]